MTGGEESGDEGVLVWNGVVARVPALVVRPTSTEDVAAAFRFAREHGLPLRVRRDGDEAGTPLHERAVTVDLSI
jgi:FAD/FMN-containing dehydrogenase